MWRGFAKTAAATALWSVVHSALATPRAKRKAAEWLGPRAEAGLYRGFYNAQSCATLALLIVYIRGLPNRELYRARGPLALLLRSGQAAGLLGMAWTAAHIGPGRLTGLDGLAAMAHGGPVPPPAEGHGPTPEFGGALPATGPFRHTRHPMNVAMPLVMWLNPRMTTNYLAFNLVGHAYLLLGSAIEEARMRATFGDRYDAYRAKGVPFYVPSATAVPDDR
ncbi:methyltransferase family protein [Tundrisphaera sp. TA3]|uniref:methyltransferase family protein n=1 Tax=Tundrisphaera sp. TA3 TaxID=3435775 RepID=UPI003EBBECA6